MEVDEKPVEDYSDIGGLDKQIQELREAIVLPITHKDRFLKLGIRPPKGVLLHGPPGPLRLQPAAVLLVVCGLLRPPAGAGLPVLLPSVPLAARARRAAAGPSDVFLKAGRLRHG